MGLVTKVPTVHLNWVPWPSNLALAALAVQAVQVVQVPQANFLNNPTYPSTRLMNEAAAATAFPQAFATPHLHKPPKRPSTPSTVYTSAAFTNATA